MDRTADASTLPGGSRLLCTDHHCPNCGVPEHVTTERVLVGTLSVTLCHCRKCEHSWHPSIEADPIA